jgi:hypothetical protein
MQAFLNVRTRHLIQYGCIIRGQRKVCDIYDYIQDHLMDFFPRLSIMRPTTTQLPGLIAGGVDMPHQVPDLFLQSRIESDFHRYFHDKMLLPVHPQPLSG